MKRGSFEYEFLETCMWCYFNLWNFLTITMKLPHKLPQSTRKFQGNFLETSSHTSTKHMEISRKFPWNYIDMIAKVHKPWKKWLIFFSDIPAERNGDSYRAIALLALPLYHFWSSQHCLGDTALPCLEFPKDADLVDLEATCLQPGPQATRQLHQRHDQKASKRGFEKRHRSWRWKWSGWRRLRQR